MSNVNGVITAAISNDEEMYNNSCTMFAAVYEFEHGDATYDFESMMIDTMYSRFASKYRAKIEDMFPEMVDMPDYYGAYSIVDALEEAYCDYLTELYNR